MGDHAFYFEDYRFKKDHPCTITFIGLCTQIHGDAEITYTGADVQTKSAIPQEWLNDLKEKLNQDYGYGPFDKSELEKIFKGHKSYNF